MSVANDLWTVTNAIDILDEPTSSAPELDTPIGHAHCNHTVRQLSQLRRSSVSYSSSNPSVLVVNSADQSAAVGNGLHWLTGYWAKRCRVELSPWRCAPPPNPTACNLSSASRTMFADCPPQHVRSCERHPRLCWQLTGQCRKRRLFHCLTRPSS